MLINYTKNIVDNYFIVPLHTKQHRYGKGFKILHLNGAC